MWQCTHCNHVWEDTPLVNLQRRCPHCDAKRPVRHDPVNPPPGKLYLDVVQQAHTYTVDSKPHTLTILLDGQKTATLPIHIPGNLRLELNLWGGQ